MKAIRLSFFQMAACLRRDRMLFAACLAPILAGVLFRFAVPRFEAALASWLHAPAVLSPYYALIDLFFSMLSPAMFCFVPAMVALEEADEKTAVYLFVTPLRKTGYLAARLCVPSAAAFLATAALLPAFKLTALSFAGIVLFAACGVLQGLIISLLILTLSSNKLEGMAVAKLSSLMLFGAAVPFFIKSGAQYALFPLPSFWAGKAMCENAPLYMLPAFAFSGVWVCFLLRQYLRKI